MQPADAEVQLVDAYIVVQTAQELMFEIQPYPHHVHPLVINEQLAELDIVVHAAHELVFDMQL